jgi:phosphorylated adapter RNA export protein
MAQQRDAEKQDDVEQQITATLQETTSVARGHITRIVQTLGPERSMALLQQAVQIEAQGGLMLPDGSRRRTPGGVFFRLVRDHTTLEERQQIWPIVSWKEHKAAARAKKAAKPTEREKA